MSPEKLKEITQAANAAVKDLDPDLKSVAFQTILNRLLAEENGEPQSPVPRKTKRRVPAKGRSGGAAGGGVSDETTKKLLESISRSKYPAMHDLKTTKEKSLYVLQIAKDDHGVDGLTPPQISKLLDQSFRVKATSQAISMALMDERRLVDRKPALNPTGGRLFSYRIMHAGEQHLKRVLEGVQKSE